MAQRQRRGHSATQSARDSTEAIVLPIAWRGTRNQPMNPTRRVNGPPTLRRRLPVQRLPAAADARFPRGFQASAAWWGQPCAWNALATNAGSIPGLWSGVERSGVLHRFAFWPSRHHRREQAFVGGSERGRPSRGWLRTRRPAGPAGGCRRQWSWRKEPCIAASVMQLLAPNLALSCP